MNPPTSRLLAAFVLVQAMGCVHASVSDPATRPASRAFDRPEETEVGRALGAQLAAHPGNTGLYVLRSGLDAFAARVLMVDAAERAIDAQYYIFRDDVTGRLLLARLLAAADRGVRVRLLLDDMGSPGLDPLLAAAQVHPHMEIRLFNALGRGPLPRLARVLDLLSRPRRLNRRMHNKMLTADGLTGIVGGRNIGDAYFDADPEVNFADTDLLAVGPVVAELGRSFDLYWNSEYTSAVAGWSRLRAEPEDLEALRTELEIHQETAGDSPYAERVRTSDLYRDTQDGRVELLWAPARAVADLPEKIASRGEALEAELFNRRLSPLFREATSELIVVSPYFIPRDSGVEFLTEATERGARVRILTNSLAATDVGLVHGAYKSFRKPMLEADAELYEMKSRGAGISQAYRTGIFSSSSASLHTKSFVFDRERVFIGSMNLDPRSLVLNTELGLVVRSPQLAQEEAERFERLIDPELSWRLRLDEDGDLLWEGTDHGLAQVRTHEPETSWWRRFTTSILALLPIEGLL